MIAAAQDPGWPWNVRGVITAHSERLETMAEHVGPNVRDVIETYTSPYSEGRVIGGSLPPGLVAAGRVLVSAAADYSALAQKELDAISPEERAETWKTVQKLRRLEQQTNQKQGVTA